MGRKFSYGDSVVIRAKDDFFAFVDGWKGKCLGYNQEGYCVVCCMREDGEKTLFVPEAELEALPA